MPAEDAPRSKAPVRDVVVVGASAGGVQVLLDLAASLPGQFPACVLVVLHVGAHRSLMPELMSARGPLRASHPEDGQPLQPGAIFVAPPDHHMLVDDGLIRLTRGAKENHARPAIDPLFRSAALACGPRVVGVLLSGRLDDGTAGLQAIKRCGGLAVVQDPDDAEQPEMPRSAMAHVDVDVCVAGARLGQVLADLVRRPATLPAPGTRARQPRPERTPGETVFVRLRAAVRRAGCRDRSGRHLAPATSFWKRGLPRSESKSGSIFSRPGEST